MPNPPTPPPPPPKPPAGPATPKPPAGPKTDLRHRANRLAARPEVRSILAAATAHLRRTVRLLNTPVVHLPRGATGGRASGRGQARTPIHGTETG